MTKFTVQLSSQTEQVLRARAAELGVSVEAVLQQLADTAAGMSAPADATNLPEDLYAGFPPPDEQTVRAALADFEAGRYRTL